jgi:hypothetical protein
MIDNTLIAERFAHVDELGDEFSRALPCVEGELNVTLAFATICALHT